MIVSEASTFFWVKVIVPLPILHVLTYRVPENTRFLPAIGKRVIVPIQQGKQERMFTGMISELHQTAPLIPCKDIIEIIDEIPLVSKIHLDLWFWIASYYHCSIGEVWLSAMPTQFRLESIWEIQATTLVEEANIYSVPEPDFRLLEALQKQPNIPLSEVPAILGTQNIEPILQNLSIAGWLYKTQKLLEPYKPKTETFIRLTPLYQEHQSIHSLLNELKLSEKQEAIFLVLWNAFLKNIILKKSEVLKQAHCSASVLQAIIDKNVAEVVKKEVSRNYIFHYRETLTNFSLTKVQEQAIKTIREQWKKEIKPILLQGVTGSGKTKVYTEFIQQYLSEGKQCLYLLPEIALTKQIIDRIKSEFTEEVGVYHSRLSDAERVEIWLAVLTGKIKIVIGVRSAAFLPFMELGLVVIDEEHEGGYKQQEPAPRYHTKDILLYFCAQHQIPIILGSATPSFESWNLAKNGKFLKVNMLERVSSLSLPVPEMVNLAEEFQLKTSSGFFSSVLLDAIRETTDKKEQVILFQNRKGYAPIVLCSVCGFVPKCLYCDVSLTYHKFQNLLKCHICGFTDEFSVCQQCGSPEVKMEGLGTERIAEQLSEIMPNLKIGRMDTETTKSKYGYLQLIESLENGEIDVLVGTQMVVKGLDVQNVTLSGVILVDQLLHFPDFRAHETAMQLLTQLCGRPGRGSKPGRVVIQTLNPENELFNFLYKPYSEFIESELGHRKIAFYPPYSRVIGLEFRHKSAPFLEEESEKLQQFLRQIPQIQVLGPSWPFVKKIRNIFRMNSLIKIPIQLSPSWVKEAMNQQIKSYYAQAKNKSLQVVWNVDMR